MAMISKTTSWLSPIFKSAWGGYWNSKKFQEMFKETYIQHSNMTEAEKFWALCGDSVTLAQLRGFHLHLPTQSPSIIVCRNTAVHREIIWDHLWYGTVRVYSVYSLSLENTTCGRYLSALFISEMVRIHSFPGKAREVEQYIENIL